MTNKDWGDRWGDQSAEFKCSKPRKKESTKYMYIQCTIDKQLCFKLTPELLGKMKVKMLLGIDTNIRVKGICYRRASIKQGHVTGAYEFNNKVLKATYISNGVWKIQVK